MAADGYDCSAADGRDGSNNMAAVMATDDRDAGDDTTARWCGGRKTALRQRKTAAARR
jgi:hypothetical protein